MALEAAGLEATVSAAGSKKIDLQLGKTDSVSREHLPTSKAFNLRKKQPTRKDRFRLARNTPKPYLESPFNLRKKQPTRSHEPMTLKSWAQVLEPGTKAQTRKATTI